MKRHWASRLAAMAVALALSACATKSRAPAGGPGTDYLRGYVGQKRVLRFQGDQDRVVVKKKDRPQLPGACDAAVQVRSAALEKGVPRLVLEPIGTAGAEKARPRCRHIPATIALSLTGFGGDSGPVVGRLDQVLPTPEGYLRAYGISFDHPSGSEPALAASSVNQVNATDQERRLEGRLTAPPRKLFWVDPIYRDPRRAVQYEGEAEIEGVVGADGRLYRTSVRGSLDKAHVAAIQRVLPMWRFEPARTGKDLTPAHVLSRLVFRIY
jgi:hypothetical protein